MTLICFASMLANRFASFWLITATICLMGGTGCKKPDYYSLPTYSNGALQAVVEIPAGDHLKTEYEAGEGFLIDTINGQPRTIAYLPYPGNYGFIPGTKMDTARGGDGDALDILVIGKRIKTGSVISVIPIATMLLLDEGARDTKIIAVPVEEKLSVIEARTYVDLMVKYPSIIDILATWFSNYEGYEANEVQRWENEQFAISEINKWRLKDDEIY